MRASSIQCTAYSYTFLTSIFFLTHITLTYTADPPTITSHPETQENIIPSKKVRFTVEASGTQPLSFHWQWKSTGNAEWQPVPLDMERFQGTDTAMLTITSVQKSDEGEYYCNVSNCAGREMSEPSVLTVGEKT